MNYTKRVDHAILRSPLIITVLILFSLNPSALYSQAPDTLWNKLYYHYTEIWAGKFSVGNEVIKTMDGGFFIIGTIGFGPANTDMLVIKTDANGDSLWTKNYEGGIYAANNSGNTGTQLEDSSFIFCGYEWGDLYLVRIGANGDSGWTSNFFYPGSNYSGASDMTDVRDSTFLITGWTNIYETNDQLFLCKVNISGNIIWSKDFGGTGNENGNEVTRLKSADYVVVGSTTSFGAGATDIYVLKLKENGDTLWTKTFGGTADDWGVDVIETPDQGLLILGITQSFGAGFNNDSYLIKTNSSGDTLWTKKYDNGGIDNLNKISPTSDGGYVLAGSSLDRIWVVKINMLGDTLWTSTYDIGVNEYANSIKQTKEGQYILTGGVKLGASALPDNAFLLKLGAAPTGLARSVQYFPQQFTLKQNYPNPFNPSTTIEFSLLKPGFVNIDVYNSLGKKIAKLVSEQLSKGNYHYKWDAQNLESGVYFYRIKSNGNTIVRRAVLLK
jgi:Secretion system C-terminal sorting domain